MFRLLLCLFVQLFGYFHSSNSLDVVSNIFALLHRRLSAVNSRKRKLIVVASLVVHCCAIKMSFLLHHSCTMWPMHSSQQKKKAPLNFCSSFKSITLGTLFQIYQCCGFSSQSPLVLTVATCERSFSKRKLIKNYLRSNLAVEKSCHTVYRATIDRQYEF